MSDIRADAAGSNREAIVTTFRIHLRNLGWSLVLVATVLIVALIALSITLRAATPAVLRLVETASNGTRLSTTELLIGSSWSLALVLVMFVVGLWYVGVVMHLAYSTLERIRPRFVAAWRATVTRTPRAAAVVVVYVAATVLVGLLTPVISVLTVFMLLLSPIVRRVRPESYLAHPKRFAVFAVPFAAFIVVVVRLGFAVPTVLFGQITVTSAFQSSWTQSRGHAARFTVVLTGIVLVSLIGSWTLIAVAVVVSDPVLTVALELAGTVLFAPLPFIAFVVLFRRMGGMRAHAMFTAPPRPSPALACLLIGAMLQTIIVATPPQSIAEAAELTTTQVILTAPAADTTWVWGDAPDVVGEVTAAGDATVPEGTVHLWAETGLAGSPDQTLAVAETTLVDGAFRFEKPDVPALVKRIWVAYDGDGTHATSSAQADPLTVDVKRRALFATVNIDLPLSDDPDPPSVTIGDTITVFAEIDLEDHHDHDGMNPEEVLAELQFASRISSDSPTTFGTATLVPNDDDNPTVYRAEITYQVTDRLGNRYFQVSVKDDETNYVVNQPNGHHLGLHVDAPDIIPANSTVELLAPSDVSYGGNVSFTATVAGPTGVPVNGSVRFTHDRSGTFEAFTSTYTLTDGQAAVAFCASSDDDVCSPTGAPRLPFADDAAAAVSVRAEYIPTGHATNPTTNALTASQSASHAIGLTVIEDGVCKDVQLFTQLIDSAETGVATPQILTAPDCDEGGYEAGTAITLDAATPNGFEFVEWTVDQNQISTAERFVYRIPSDDVEWLSIQATYRLACHQVVADVEGSANLVLWPIAIENPLLYTLGTCQRPDGSPGVHHLTQTMFIVETTINPDTDEFDVLYGHGPLPAGGEMLVNVRGHRERQGRFSFLFPVGSDVTIPVTFGPVCRSIETPPSPYGVAEILTPTNCTDTVGTGYLHNSSVTARAATFDDTNVFSGWRINDEPIVTAGSASAHTFTVTGRDPLRVEVEHTVCHTIDVAIDTVAARTGGGQALVNVTPSANCPDGSERWRDQTAVRLVPVAAGYLFGGWSDPDGAEGLDVRGTVFTAAPVSHFDPAQGSRQVLMNAPLVTTAHFYMPNSMCSDIRVFAPPGVQARFPDAGCGPGQYLDEAKQQMLNRNDPVTRAEYADEANGLWQYPERLLRMEVLTDQLLSATGWVTMSQSFEQGPSWRSLPVPFDCEPPSVSQAADGSFQRNGVIECWLLVRGDLAITVNTCQALEPIVSITRAGDLSGRVFHPADLGLTDHYWITGTVSQSSPCSHPDARQPYLWLPNREVTLRAQAPAFGFEFLDWGHVDFDTGVELFIGEDPTLGRAPLAVNVRTTDTQPTLRAEVNYQVHCGTLSHDSNIRIESPRPNCPGNAPGELSYIVGTFVEISADATRGGRNFERFRGVVANTVGLDNTGRPSALVLIAGDTSVSSVYPTGQDRFVSALGTVGKPFLGVVTLAALAGVTVACPPCGVALTALTASAFLLDLIPGVGGMASAALDLINPLSILECTARWSFGSTSNAEPVSQVDGIKSTGTTAITSIRFAYEASTDGTQRAIGTVSARTTGRVVGSGAQFAYGLYEHRIDQIDLNYQSTEQLRDTATWNACLNDKYRAAT